MADPAAPSSSAEQAARQGRGLHGNMVSGAAWKATSQTTLQVVQIVTTIVLSRILGPHQFGLVGMVTVFSALIFYFTDLSFSAALVQRAEITEAHKATAFWTSVAGGIFVTLIGIAISPLVANFYNTPAVEPLFAVMSLNMIVLALGKTQTALLQRSMQFRAMEIRAIVAGCAGAVVGIGMAVAGYGPWALVGQVLTISIVRTTLVWIASRWRPTFQFSRAAWKDIRSYSRNLLVTNVLYFVNGNADNLIVGKFLGAAALGIYRLSYTVMLMPINRLVLPMRAVLFPVLSRMEGDRSRMRAAWLRVNRVIGAVTIPALVGLICTAPDMVPVVLGPKWHSAVTVIQVLTVVGLLQTSQRLNDGVLQACGLTKKQMRFAVVAFVLNIIGFLWGVKYGVVGVAVGAAAANGIVQLPYLHITAKAVDSSIREVAASLKWILLATAVMAASVLGVRHAMLSMHHPHALGRLLIEAAVGTLVYLAVMWVFDRKLFDEVVALVRVVKQRRRGGGGAGRRYRPTATPGEPALAGAGAISPPAPEAPERQRNAIGGTTMVLLALGGGVLALRRRRRR